MAIYFIADLHLCTERPDLTEALLRFIDDITPDAEQLYILGDLFEAWIGDDCLPAEIAPVMDKLKQLSTTDANNTTIKPSAGCQIFFQHGNRDFLVGEQFLTQYGIQLISEYHKVTYNQDTVLLLHGDQLCSDDLDYQKFRVLVRNPDWQKEFLAKPLAERLMIAKQLRQTSQDSNSNKSQSIMDVNQDTVLETFECHQVHTMIHGHTHRPNTHHHSLNGQPVTRFVLGDWDAYLWYLKWDKQGISTHKKRIIHL